MNASTFDTHAAVKALREAGADEGLAEAITNEIRNGQGDLATKADLEAGLASLETRLVKWAIALVSAAVVIIGVLIRLL